MTRKWLPVLIALLCTLLLQSCSYVADVILRNGTGSGITLISRGVEIHLGPGQSATLLEPRFMPQFDVRFGTTLRRYIYRRPPDEGFFRLRMGGLNRGEYNLRAMPNHEIEALAVDAKRRVVTESVAQPEGYPLHPEP